MKGRTEKEEGNSDRSRNYSEFKADTHAVNCRVTYASIIFYTSTHIYAYIFLHPWRAPSRFTKMIKKKGYACF